MAHLTLFRKSALFIFISALICALVTGNAAADPAALTDQELDGVSAQGAFPGAFGIGPLQIFTPSTEASGENETEINNFIYSIASPTNINTALNFCILAHCQNTNAEIEASPLNDAKISVINNAPSTVQNMSSVGSFVPSLPIDSGASLSATSPMPNWHGMSQQAGGKLPPALPKHGFGSN